VGDWATVVPGFALSGDTVVEDVGPAVVVVAAETAPVTSPVRPVAGDSVDAEGSGDSSVHPRSNHAKASMQRAKTMGVAAALIRAAQRLSLMWSPLPQTRDLILS